VAGQQLQAPKAQARDLSEAAVSRAVLTATVQKPYVLYPAVVGVLGSAAALLLGPSPLFVVPAVLGGLVGFGSWALDFFLRRDRHAATYLREVHRALSNRRVDAVRTLGEQLRELEADGALAQLERLEEKFEAFRELLDKKLNPGEITHGRYLGMAEQVFLSGLDNLQRLAYTLESVRAIDERYIGRRILELERKRELPPAQQQELDSLRQRAALSRQQQEKAALWLAQNEQAMTQMDLTMAAIAAMDTVRGHAGTDMETAMRELAELARRAPQYGLGGSATERVTEINQRGGTK